MTITRRILLVLTSHDRIGDTGRPTGFYVSEAAHPWLALTERGHTVDVLSVAGGRPPMDGLDPADPVQRRFLDDPAVREALGRTPAAADVDPAGYDAVMFAGGHGTMWDFPGSTPLQLITRDVWERGGVVAAVCHGPAALVDVRLSDGSFLVAGRRMAAFTDSEERAVGLDAVVPFLLSGTLAERGARLEAAADFQAQVVVDGRLVTGQNPASAPGVAAALAEALSPVPA
ncbi:MAG: type 1 glutamine amidotransferase domain-containing protein [Kineosporiaceae bacterium]